MNIRKKHFSLILFLPLLALSQNVQYPTRIVLTWEGDPARSQSVTWRMDGESVNPVAQILPVGTSARAFEDNAATVNATTEKLTTEAGETVYHYTARFEDLQPDSRYVYRVGDENVWSEWNVLRTAGADTGTFSFIYLGDVQNEIYENASPLLRSAYAHAPDSRFILIAGDLVSDGPEDHQWEEFFQAFGFIPRMMPLVPAPGNHDKATDDEGENGIEYIAPLYLAHFALADNGPGLDALRESAYYMDYQSARFVVFNSNSLENPNQLEWLEKTLQTNPKSWLIVTHHHPVYSTGRDRNNEELRELLVPLYEKYGVDMVLQGHDHHYGRTPKIVQDQIAADDAKGVVYAVSVSGPKMYEQNKNFLDLMAVELGDTQLYQIITLNPKMLRYEAWTLDRRMVDGFTLTKDGDGATLMENQIPD